MIDYTLDANDEPIDVVRGGEWPPGGAPLTVTLTRATGWTTEDEWTWALCFSRLNAGGTPDLVVTAATVSIGDNEDAGDNEVLTLTFYLTAAETLALGGDTKQLFRVDLRSTDASDHLSYWDVVQGTATVRGASGQG